MKRCIGKLLLISILSLSLNWIMAQSYVPMVIEGATWVYNGEDDGIPVPKWRYFIQGDQMHNGKLYKKLHLNGNQVGLLREDTDSRKVYISQADPNSVDLLYINYDSLDYYLSLPEILFCNFSYQLYDSVHLDYDFSHYNGRIEAITYDSLFGAYRKVWHFGDTSFNYYDNLIEGIGSKDGFLGTMRTLFHAGHWFYLESYCISDDGTCAVNNKDILQEDLAFYPNPAHDLIRLDNIEDLETFYIYSLDGKRLDAISATNLIDVSSLPRGIFFLIAKDKNGTYRRAQFEKQ